MSCSRAHSQPSQWRPWTSVGEQWPLSESPQHTLPMKLVHLWERGRPPRQDAIDWAGKARAALERVAEDRGRRKGGIHGTERHAEGSVRWRRLPDRLCRKRAWSAMPHPPHRSARPSAVMVGSQGIGACSILGQSLWPRPLTLNKPGRWGRERRRHRQAPEHRAPSPGLSQSASFSP